jgi:Trp operon repressor
MFMISYTSVFIYFQDLLDVVKSSFEGDNKNALLALLLPKPEYEAMCLHNALKVLKISQFVRFV